MIRAEVPGLTRTRRFIRGRGPGLIYSFRFHKLNLGPTDRRSVKLRDFFPSWLPPDFKYYFFALARNFVPVFGFVPFLFPGARKFATREGKKPLVDADSEILSSLSNMDTPMGPG